MAPTLWRRLRSFAAGARFVRHFCRRCVRVRLLQARWQEPCEPMVGRERFSDIVGQVDRPARPSRAARRQAQGQHVGYRNVGKATPGLPTPAVATDDVNEFRR
jgi:hypothetical protein